MANRENPVDVARKLASIYGHKLDHPVVYTQGVSLSGRLRLHALERTALNPAPAIVKIVDRYVDDPEDIFGPDGGTANFAGLCWGDELSEATGDSRYADLLVDVANQFQPPTSSQPIAPPLDTDIRVEDFLFAGTMLGRAYRLTGDEKHIETLVTFLLVADTLQDNGLWWHCKASPFFWGRGNAFAAMGFAEALTYIPRDHPKRDDLLLKHLTHLAGLSRYQDETGMWRQVIDRLDTYLEHSATTMIGYAIARGLRSGWLGPEWKEVVERAWIGASSRIGPECELEHVCVGTGPLSNLDDYVNRAFSDGQDDRGGAMALWFAIEMARLEANA